MAETPKMVVPAPETPAPPKLTPYSYGETSPMHHPAHRAMATQPLLLAEFDPIPPALGDKQPQYPPPTMVTTHQVKGVQTFTGKDKHSLRLEDWIRDVRFLLQSKGTLPGTLQFQEVVRYTGGRARDVLLNLDSRTPIGVDAEAAFIELLEEFGEDKTALSPVAKFYSRVQRENETPMDYAIALESTLREVDEARRRRGQTSAEDEGRDRMLSTQFMAGLRDFRFRQRLAPMQPRFMAFRDIRRELHVIAEEEKRTAELRRQQSPFISMSEVAQSLPQVKSKGGVATRPAPPVKEVATQPRSGSDDQAFPGLHQLLNQQLDEMKVMYHKQMDALGQVAEEQRHQGQRLAHLEAAVFRPQVTGPPRPRALYTGCFRCGNKSHLARNCPGGQQPPAQVNFPRMKTPSSPAGAQQVTPAAQHQIHQTAAKAPVNEQNLQM